MKTVNLKNTNTATAYGPNSHYIPSPKDLETVGYHSITYLFLYNIKSSFRKIWILNIA